MKVKTNKATEKQLDWGLAVSDNRSPQLYCERVEAWQIDEDGNDGMWEFSHLCPIVCMGLIKQYRIDIVFFTNSSRVDATIWCKDLHDPVEATGDTLEQAVARCVIKRVLGDEFEVPDELGVML